MTSAIPPRQHLISLFAKSPCWMIQPLAAEMHYSIPSVRRFLAETGYYSSFNHNGAWYTLRSIPRFGRNGLWFYQGIGFSRAGSLTNTLIALINASPAGMSAEMLGENLRCRCHGVLANLWRKGKIHRQKIGPRHIYFAADPHKRTIQSQALAAQDLPEVRFSAEIAVLVLAEFIRSPDSTFEQLAQGISRTKNVTVNAKQIEQLFVQHGLKKTMQISEHVL
ncbi:MAG TPA: hypothetical protein ENF70_03775 [Deltaproteobacteria bacterium]|nr:hypothetical protein [Deltaproteobacteria bacterium]